MADQGDDQRARARAYAKAYHQRNRRRVCLKSRLRRRRDVVGAICTDARQADRKRGHEYDLDREFVASVISRPCAYCGDETLRRTLDRIDNSKGHLRSNVVCACERCNYVRRDMPYDAWLVLVSAIRAAREQGLFGGWTGAIHRRDPFGSETQGLLQLELPLRLLRRRGLKPHGTLARYKACGPPPCQDCKDAMAAWKRRRRAGS